MATYVVEKRDGWQGRAVERYSTSDQEAVSIAANAKTPSHESSSWAVARLEAGCRCWAHRHSMIGQSLLVLLAFISFSACSYPGAYSTSHDVKFSKRGITQQQLDADWSACRKENTVAMSFAEDRTEANRATSFAEEYLINGCMAARGYTVTW